ncbi:MAG: hypothetical protein J5806_11065 [Lentisphaeria bacterium]|nr:hypothetical protein [Lentisphaeria bacterium]
MNKKTLMAGVLLLALAGCRTAPQPQPALPERRSAGSDQPREITLTPNSIPGTPRDRNNQPTGGYAPSNVQAQLKIDVKDGTKEVNVIRDNNDPYVITKPYILKQADPYAVRSYLEAAVGAKSVNDSPAQVMAVKYADGTGVILVSAEEYRFQDSKEGRGIDNIVAALDRKGLTYLPEADTHIYFPRISRASNLRDMLQKVGSSELDPQFAVAPGSILVDAELNALLVKAPDWNWKEMREMLKKYDRPIPEVRITYRVLEIYAENDDRIGVDFQSWKNNDGVDLFSTGMVVRRNWGTFFTSGVQDTGLNRTNYWNFNPKWNTRYLDLMTSIGKAKCLAQGEIVAQNRKTSQLQVCSGFFYDRTYYKDGATSIAEGTKEFVYTDINPDTILRESITKIMPPETIKETYNDMGLTVPVSVGGNTVQVPLSNFIVPAGYTLRMMGTQTTTNSYYEAAAKALGDNAKTSPISKYLTGYVDADGKATPGAYYNIDWNTRTAMWANKDASPGIIHGWLQYPMVVNGFQFDLKVTPIVTGNAVQIKFDLSSISLLGWNADGSARRSTSKTATTVQIGTKAEEFVIGGLRKSESVRSTTGLPFFKDLPVIGRALSTESESLKQSQLVLIAQVHYSNPDDGMGEQVRENLGKVIKDVNNGMDSRVGNMFFQQYFLDSDRSDWHKRLDKLGDTIDDNYQTVK